MRLLLVCRLKLNEVKARYDYREFSIDYEANRFC